MNRAVVMLGAVALIAGLAPATDASPPAQPGAKRGVCKGVKDCYVMGHVDVTGDRKRDWVGAVNHHAGRKIKKGTVTIRVLSNGRIRRKRLEVRHWEGSVFHGIARIDGRRGAEMVVGARRRVHKLESHFNGKPGTTKTYSKAFHVVTVRHGSMVREKAPGKKQTRRWWLTPPKGVASGVDAPDASFSHRRGYYRHARHGRVRMVRKDAACGGVVGCTTSRVRFRWRHGHWVRNGRKLGDPSLKGGWHVRGLDVW